MARPGDFLTVIPKIYEASLEPGGIDRLAGVVAEALGTRSGFLALLHRPAPQKASTPDIAGLPSATENFDDWARTAYAEHYHGCNIWFQRGVTRGFPAIVLGQELAAEDELVASEWYEYCRRLDAFHVLGAQFHLDQQFSVQFGAHRPRHSRAFGEGSRRKMAKLLPHLQRALQIQVRLGLCERATAVTEDILDRLGVGVLVLDANRKLLFANRVADRLLSRSSALRLTNGRLSAWPRAAAAFERLVSEAAGPQGLGGMLNIATDDKVDLRVLASPLARDHWPVVGSSPAVLVLVNDLTEARTTPAHHLRQAFGLTESEAILLSALAAGEGLPEHAERLDISVETVRTHLKHLLLKTGQHRQADLVRVVLSDPLFRVAAAP